MGSLSNIACLSKQSLINPSNTTTFIFTEARQHVSICEDHHQATIQILKVKYIEKVKCRRKEEAMRSIKEIYGFLCLNWNGP
jgi:hypothetical protein